MIVFYFIYECIYNELYVNNDIGICICICNFDLKLKVIYKIRIVVFEFML